VSREQLFAAFFFVVLLFLLHELYRFVLPFAGPLAWAAILALVFFPLANRLTRTFGGRRSIAAGMLVLAITVLAILPSIYLGSLLVRQAAAAYGWLKDALEPGATQALVERLRASRLGGLWHTVAPMAGSLSIDLSDIALRATSWISDQIVGQATAIARNALGTLGRFLLMLVALFFFLRDGDGMARGLRDLIPMERGYKDAIFARFTTTLTAVVQSMVLTAVLQGCLAGLGYALAGLSFALFLAFLTGLASFLPLAGPALIWSSAAVYLALTGHTGAAVFLALWGAGIVSSVDNLIKPLFIGGQARLPTFPLLLAILGGLVVYGFLGVFVGPVILAILLSFLDIYREEYHAEPAVVTPAPAPRDRAASG
jgi:predicted PurR-regulated permease PerM